MATFDARWKAHPAGTAPAVHEDVPVPFVAIVLWVALLGFAGVMYATVVGAQAESEELPRLEDVTVTPPAGTFETRDALLRLLLERSTPCLGCDAVQIRPSRSEGLLEYLVVGMPREPDDAQRFSVEVRHLDEGPELELTRQ